MSTRLHIVVSEGLVARIDAARGPGQPRADFIRRAVERALGDTGAHPSSRQPPAPAEQPEDVEAALVGLDQSALSRPRIGDRDPVPAPPEQPYLSEDELRERHGVEAVVPPDPKVGDEVPLRRVSPPGPRSPRVPFRRDVKPFQRGDK